MDAKTQKAELTRAAIVGAALDLAAAEGLESITLQAVADRIGDLSPQVGVGAGVRWRSPVGPLQADLAYGVKTKEVRLHLRLGFSF